jgi:replication factor A1
MAQASGLRVPSFVTVEQLKPGSLGHNLVVMVVSSQVVVDKSRPDGSKVKVAEAVVGDQTGCITLTARNDQIDALVPGTTVVVRNAKIDMFKGFMRLAVDKWGSLKRAEHQETYQVKSENNLSQIEYELVDLQK